MVVAVCKPNNRLSCHSLAKSWWIDQLIEGLITAVLGILLYLFVTDFPDRNSFLTKEETEFVLKRVEDDRIDSLPDGITFVKVLKHLGDWTIWAYGTSEAWPRKYYWR